MGVLFIAHRGASYWYPENTVKAVKAALEFGADGVEVDIRETADGTLILSHDEKLSRLSQVNLRVSEITLTVLKGLKVFQREPYATLDEVLKLIKKGGKPGTLLLLHIKVTGIEEKVANALLKHNLVRTAIPIADELPILQRFKQILSNVRTGAVFFHRPPKRQYPEYVDVIIVHRNFITRELVNEVRGTGRPLYAFGVEEISTARELAELGVDGIITGRPEIKLYI